VRSFHFAKNYLTNDFSNHPINVSVNIQNLEAKAIKDFADIYITDPVDKVTHGGVQIAQPIFKYA
jgi:hypothetical protein